ncbi:MAG: SusC/RagA family TonB-linked outer membrane protein, partial [Salinibacter sp.]
SLYGIFGQQSFGLSDMLFVTGALRFDASSVFGAAERWQTYPKLSASYVLSEHDGWQETFGSVVSNFKLRGSIGWSGGLTSIGPFDRFTNYNSASFGEKPGLQPSSQLGASDIKPERQREIEFGVDASFLNDRLGVRFTYYRQRTTDLLLRRSVAPTTGFNTRLANVGTLQNNGIELRVRGVPVSTDAFRWTSTATYSRNQNEVTGIPTRGGNVGAVTLPVSFGVSQARNGYSLGVYFGSAFKRNDQGQVVDTKGNVLVEDENGYWRPKNCDVSQSGCTGIPAQADSQKVVGNPQPDFTGSWINQFAIGDNLSVRVQFDAEIGQDVFNFFRRIGAAPFFGTLNDYERELEGDLPSGYNAAAFGIFEHWVEDGSYVKLREVAINYTIEPNGLPLESITLNASGRNLLSFDNYSGYDPETNVAGQSTGVRGFDFGTVPIPRTYSLGVRVKF